MDVNDLESVKILSNDERESIDVQWWCPECNVFQSACQYDIAVAGIPICSECGDDMEIK